MVSLTLFHSNQTNTEVFVLDRSQGVQVLNNQPVYIFAPLQDVKCLQAIMSKTGVMFRINDYQLNHWSADHQVCYFKYAQLSGLQRLILDNARMAGAKVEALLAYFEAHFGQIEIDLLGPENLLQMDINFSGSGRYQQYVRRVFDIAAALAGLVLFLIPGLLVAAWIRLDSGDPVFFLQKRTGLYNREFRIVKFRSMYPDAERHGACWAEHNDERITRAGR